MPYDEDHDPGLKKDGEEKENKAENGQEEKKEEKFSFLQETIKPKPISREKLLKELVRIAVYGVIIGVFACLGFYALKPWAQSWFRGNPETVTIPEDTDPEEDQTEEDEEEKVQEPVLDRDNYEELMDSMYTAVETAQKSVVSVSMMSAAEDWEARATGVIPSVTGVVTADNGQELLILADASVCGEEKEWTVTFSDGSQHKASLKKQDKNSGFAMFSIQRSSITDAQWNAVRVAVLGNSNVTRQGDTVMALGAMFGYPDGVSYGIISSVSYKETFYDGECDVLATDIPASEQGTGVLFNLEGEVIGMSTPSVWGEEESASMNAYAISDIKSTIELLANGRSVPYAGVYGTAVTAEIQKQNEMPEGVYVIDVDPDSPAMEAGIQSGDVIQQVAGEGVTSMTSYQKALLKVKTGQQVRFKGKRLGADGYVDVDFTVTIGSKE